MAAGPTTIGGPDRYQGILDGRFKYIEYDTGEVEFYDLIADPFELDSLTRDPAYDAQQARLADRLRSAKGLLWRLVPPNSLRCVRLPEGCDSGLSAVVVLLPA